MCTRSELSARLGSFISRINLNLLGLHFSSLSVLLLLCLIHIEIIGGARAPQPPPPPPPPASDGLVETDAALALALQMGNMDNTYAALFTVDDQKQELYTTEEVNSDEIEMFVPNQGDGEDQTIPTAEDVLTELAQQVDISNITKFNVIGTKIFDSAKRALNRKKFNPCHKISFKFTDDVGSSEGSVDLGGTKA